MCLGSKRLSRSSWSSWSSGCSSRTGPEWWPSLNNEGETTKRGQKGMCWETSRRCDSNKTKTILLLQQAAEEPEKQPIILQKEKEEDLSSVANSTTLQTAAKRSEPDYKATVSLTVPEAPRLCAGPLQQSETSLNQLIYWGQRSPAPVEIWLLTKRLTKHNNNYIIIVKSITAYYNVCFIWLAWFKCKPMAVFNRHLRFVLYLSL